jgi:hypothetical protein
LTGFVVGFGEIPRQHPDSTRCSLVTLPTALSGLPKRNRLDD